MEKLIFEDLGIDYNAQQVYINVEWEGMGFRSRPCVKEGRKCYLRQMLFN